MLKDCQKLIALEHRFIFKAATIACCYCVTHQPQEDTVSQSEKQENSAELRKPSHLVCRLQAMGTSLYLKNH